MFVTVFAKGIEPKVVGSGFGQEVEAGREGFDFVEFVLDEAVGGFDVGLPGVSGRGDGGMEQAGHGLNGGGESTVVTSLDAADKLGAIVGLKMAILQNHPAVLKMVNQQLRKEGGARQGALLGVGQEMQAADHLAGGVLDQGQAEAADLRPHLGNIVEVFGIDVDLFK